MASFWCVLCCRWLTEAQWAEHDHSDEGPPEEAGGGPAVPGAGASGDRRKAGSPPAPFRGAAFGGDDVYDERAPEGREGPDPLIYVVNRRAGGPRAAYDVYIGRPSKWGNPFVIGKDGDRAEVLRKYEAWLRTRPELLAALPELRGKVLGCWCAPEPCHGDVLSRLANVVRQEGETVR